MIMKISTAWYPRRRGGYQASCKCQLGCTELATRYGYNTYMETVPLAAGHGRKMESGS